MGETFSYIPPRSPLDRPQPELVLVFLDAVARVTPAFKELRDKILPVWNRPFCPVDEVMAWLKRWHLDFENHELREMIESWTIQILDWWKKHPATAAELKIDLDWWNRTISSVGDKPAFAIGISKWDEQRENPQTYRARILRQFETLIDQQIEQRKSYLNRFGVRPYAKRPRDRSQRIEFEWLALFVCLLWTDGKIAIKYKANRDTVKKARQRLSQALKISTGGDTR